MIEVRLRFGKGARKRFDAATDERASLLREMARSLMRAKVEPERAERYLRDAGNAPDGEFKRIWDLVEELCAGVSKPKVQKPSTRTFRVVGEEWTNGDLHRRFPDQVPAIFHDFNRQRLERHMYPVIGDTPIRQVSRALCDEVMRRLPKTLKSRRHIAALLNRVLNLAELAGYIDRNPLPRGWLPKPLPRKLWAVLYPAEDRALLGAPADKVPLCYRVLYGFLHREGMRKGEATALVWGDLDLENGVVELDKNKTDHARGWQLDPGVHRALVAWHKLRGEPGADGLVFVDEAGGAFESEHMAGTLRVHMKAAGLSRAALFAKGELRGRFGLHSFRRSFVTRVLANGRPEDWVRRRSGHKSGELLRYRQHASGLAELALGEVDPLAAAIPELAQVAGPVGGPAVKKPQTEVTVSKRKMTISEGGGTGRRTSLRFDQASAAADAGVENAGDRDARDDVTAHDVDDAAQPLAHVDPVEVALADALQRAALAGAFDTVAALTAELKARRESRSKVVSLDAARSKRGRK